MTDAGANEAKILLKEPTESTTSELAVAAVSSREVRSTGKCVIFISRRRQTNKLTRVFQKNATSCQDVLDDMSMHIGEATLNAVVIETEFFVVDAELVQCGGVEVVAVGGILRRLGT